MPREEVDRASLTVDRVRDFGVDLRSKALEPEGAPSEEARMGLVDKPIQIAGTPTDRHDHLGVERLGDASHLPQRYGIELAALRSRNGILADVGLVGHVRLAPRAPM